MKRLVLAALLLSCGPAEVGDEPVTPKPFDGTVEPGGSATFGAVVAAAGAAVITWSADVGTITASGLYTAPGCAWLIASLPPGTNVNTADVIEGRDTVHAAWDGGSLDIPVAVREQFIGPIIDPASLVILPDGTRQFTSLGNRYTCHDARAQ